MTYNKLQFDRPYGKWNKTKACKINKTLTKITIKVDFIAFHLTGILENILIKFLMKNKKTLANKF